MRFQNGCNKVAIELRVVLFWSEIILVISNRTRAARSFDFEIMRMISDQTVLHSVQLPLLITHLFIGLCSQYTREKREMTKVKHDAPREKRDASLETFEQYCTRIFKH